MLQLPALIDKNIVVQNNFENSVPAPGQLLDRDRPVCVPINNLAASVAVVCRKTDQLINKLINNWYKISEFK